MPKSHLHILEETCPVCDQPIPNDRADEVRARAEEQERALTQAAEARAAQQLQAEKTRIEAAASANIEQLRADQALALSRLAAEATAKETAAREAGGVRSTLPSSKGLRLRSGRTTIRRHRPRC